jgi:tRNA(Ile)-lysidine synthase
MLALIRRHELFRPGDRVGVAVSGGADSVALLRLLLEARSGLGILLTLMHFNHRIRAAEADADEAFVAELAQRNQLEFHCGSADTIAHAQQSQLSLEAAARELRYGYFRRLLAEGAVRRIATAHTLDDQAETVLLRFLRGTGTRGLAAIYPKVAAETSVPEGDLPPEQAPESVAQPTIVRPLLGTRRQQLREYLVSLGQTWQEDATNLDLKHSRNRVRHELIPLLERDYNPGLQQVLAETAEVAREEERFWAEETARVLVNHQADGPLTLQIGLLQQQPLAMRRRLIRAVAQSLGAQLDFHHVEQVLSLAALPGETRRAELPGGWMAVAGGGKLWFESRRAAAGPAAYDYELPIPGQVQIPELGLAIRALLVDAEAYNQCLLLDPKLMGPGLRVRNWRTGDRYQPAHTKSARKLKELLQERHISYPQRAFWPVVLWGERIVWVPGWDFPDFQSYPEDLRLRTTGPGVLLEQQHLASEDPL